MARGKVFSQHTLARFYRGCPPNRKSGALLETASLVLRDGGIHDWLAHVIAAATAPADGFWWKGAATCTGGLLLICAWQRRQYTVRLLTHVLCKPTDFFFHSFIATMSYSLQTSFSSLMKDWADKCHVWGTPTRSPSRSNSR